MNAWDAGQPGLPSPGSVLHNFDVAYSIPDIASRTGPGHFTFLDQMVVGVAANGHGDNHHKGGVPGPGLNHDETQAHMTMWVMAASPLLTCNDVRNMTDDILEILTNPEVLAVHKDPAARMAVRIDVGGGVEESHAANFCSSDWSVYGKPLSDGSMAVMVLNRGTVNASVTVPFEDVGDSMFTSYAVRDLWLHQNLTASGRGILLDVAPHGVRMLRLWPIAPPPPAPLPTCPNGFLPHTGGYWYNTDPCPNNDWSHCTEDHVNATMSACAARCVGTPGCVAFELYYVDIPVSEQACYTFNHEMEAPFTSSPNAITCVRSALV